MRKPGRRREFPVPIIVGVIIGGILIGVALMGQARRPLVDVFEAAPTPALPALFANLGDTSAAVVTNWLRDGAQLPAVTPQAVGPRIAVHVDELQRVGTVLAIRGTIFNNTATTIPFSINNFQFVDATGVGYNSESAVGTIMLETSAPFAFNIPVPPSRALTMTVTLDPDPPLVIALLQERSTP